MAREKETSKAALEYANEEIIAAPYDAFMAGAQWADRHPHWISVDEQDIPLGQWVITYAPNEINYCNIDVELLAMDETAEDFGITHWMPLPQAPKKGGEK